MRNLRVAFLLISFILLTQVHALFLQKAYSLPLRELATFRDWSVFVTASNSHTHMCYALSTPYRTRALSILRNLPFIVVRHVKGEEFTLSATSGFQLSPQYGMVFEIENRSHRLTEGSNSFTWTSSYIQDRSIIGDMICSSDKGKRYFKVRSYAEEGDAVLDYYSLLGLKESMRYMIRNCS